MDSYADDGGVTASDPDVAVAAKTAQTGVNAVGQFADVTGMQSRIKKCHQWCTHESLFREAKCCLKLNGQPLSYERQCRMLGALACYNGKLPNARPAWIRDRFDKYFVFCERLRRVPLNMHTKDKFIGDGPAARVVFGSQAATFDPIHSFKVGQQSLWHRARQSLLSALTNDKHKLRCPELYLTLLTKFHRSDPYCATLYNILRDARLRLTEGSHLRESYIAALGHKHSRRFAMAGAVHGPTSQLHHAAEAVGWRVEVAGGTVRFVDHAAGTGTDCTAIPLPEWEHRVRDALRARMWRDAEARHRLQFS
eukprot:gene12380-19438_t